MLSATRTVAAPPAAAFDLFGSRGAAGWILNAVCDRVEVGAPVTLRLPLDGPRATVDVLGHIAELRRPRQLVIVHTQPWRGTLRLTFRPDGEGTSVRVDSEVDEPGLEWLMRRRGLSFEPAESRNPRIGLLTTKSGPGCLFAAAGDNVARLAVDEVNADGGVTGRPVELLVGDDRTDPVEGVEEARRLVRAGCRVIVVATTSATFAAVAAALRTSGVLLLHALMNEGGADEKLCIRLGERPAAQIAAAAGPMMRLAGGRRWFLAGNDYCWPQATNATARAMLPDVGGRVVGERRTPLGSGRIDEVVDAVVRAEPDVVLSTFVGSDSAEFERRCHDAGLRDSTVTIAPAMDESTLERAGDGASGGLYGVSGYFEPMETEANTSLLQRYRAAYGRFAPPLSSLTECVFEAIHMWTTAARNAGTVDPERVAEEIRLARYELPRGTVALTDGVAEQRLYLAEAVDARFRVRMTSAAS